MRFFQFSTSSWMVNRTPFLPRVVSHQNPVPLASHANL